MLQLVAFTSLLGGLLAWGCATSAIAPRTFGGTSGPVKWEVVDIGQLVATNDTGFRWSYTVVLTNTGKSTIQFEQLQRGSRAANLAVSAVRTIPFARSLAPGAETRANFADTWEFSRGSGAAPFGGPGGLGTLTVERRFTGKDEHGASVIVPVILHLDRSIGKASVHRPSASRPPSKDVRPSDLAQLAGSWQGHYREPDDVFNVPLRIEVAPDGSFEAFEYDPVTNRFQGRLRVENGRIAWTQNRDSGVLNLHEGSGRRLLIGTFSGPRDAVRPGSSFTAELWLEAGPSVGSVSPAPAPPRSAGLPAAVQTAFEEYKADPKYTHFKAFAMDRMSGFWGRAWGIPSAAGAMERALYECGKRSSACGVYAVSDTVLESVSSEERAAVVLGGAQLTYKGTLTTEREGRVATSPAAFYLLRGRTEITGSWSSDDPELSGVITGGVSATNQATVRMTQTRPCRVEFTGAVSIADAGRTLDASYAGPGCDGVPLKVTFTGIRQ